MGRGLHLSDVRSLLLLLLLLLLPQDAPDALEPHGQVTRGVEELLQPQGRAEET